LPSAAPEDRLASAIGWMPRLDSTLWIAFLADTGQFGESELMDCVSAAEAAQASRIADAEERRHLLVRRSFQRSFLKTVIGWQGSGAGLPMHAARDERPRCDAAPGLCLSFSSSGPLAVACASSGGDAGVDVERVRPAENATALAERFFSPPEARRIASLEASLQGLEFLRYWTIKEACLKAIGKGVVYGLDRFAIKPIGGGYAVEPPAEFGNAASWTISCLECPDGFIATMSRYFGPPRHGSSSL
jgi:phosphopantetheinyl transferase